MDKAGAYGIQGIAGKFVSRIDGSYSAVVGFTLAGNGSTIATSPVAEKDSRYVDRTAGKRYTLRNPGCSG